MTRGQSCQCPEWFVKRTYVGKVGREGNDGRKGEGGERMRGEDWGRVEMRGQD